MYVVTIRGRKVLAWGVLALALVLAGSLYVRALGQGQTLETAAWGLSFQTPGQAPVGNATVEELGAYDAKFLGDTQEKTIYLTFDCGYENGNTAAILDALQAHQAPAAFFVVGNYLETAPDLVRRMVAEGHIVGNHTWSHPNMSEISEEAAFQSQLDRVQAEFLACTGEEMSMYYRPPQGVYSQENLEMAKALGYKTVFWSLAYVDWETDQQPDPQAALEKLTARIHPGAVVLLHNTSSTNAAILDQLLTQWETMGYSFGTLDQLFGEAT